MGRRFEENTRLEGLVGTGTASAGGPAFRSEPDVGEGQVGIAVDSRRHVVGGTAGVSDQWSVW